MKITNRETRQTTRLIKVSCINHYFECGMVFRTSSKWIVGKALMCPACGQGVKIG